MRQNDAPRLPRYLRAMNDSHTCRGIAAHETVHISLGLSP